MSKNPAKAASLKTDFNEIQENPSVSSHGMALYSPYIHIRDANWLKAALLYWEGIRRIVPDPPYNLLDDSRIALAVQEGLVKRTSPEPYRAGAADRFRRQMLPMAQNKSKGAEQLWRLVREVPRTDLFEVHPEKIDPGLRDWMSFEKLAEQADVEFIMAPEVATTYMTCLTAEMSQKIGAPPVTDQKASEQIGQFVLFGQTAAEAAVPKESLQVLQLQLPFPTPQSLNHVTMEYILKFREDFSSERRALRNTLEKALKNAPTIEDTNQLNDLLRDLERQIAESLTEQRKKLKETAVINGALSLTVPTGIAGALKALAALPLEPFSLGIGCGALLTAAWWGKYQQDKQKVVSVCPYHYFLTLEKNFPQ